MSVCLVCVCVCECVCVNVSVYVCMCECIHVIGIAVMFNLVRQRQPSLIFFNDTLNHVTFSINYLIIILILIMIILPAATPVHVCMYAHVLDQCTVYCTCMFDITTCST